MKYLVIVEQFQSANQGSPHGFISVSALPPEEPMDAGGAVQNFRLFSLPSTPVRHPIEL